MLVWLLLPHSDIIGRNAENQPRTVTLVSLAAIFVSLYRVSHSKAASASHFMPRSLTGIKKAVKTELRILQVRGPECNILGRTQCPGNVCSDRSSFRDQWQATSISNENEGDAKGAALVSTRSNPRGSGQH
ncbi:hypothetical protein K491DRAFT_135536 [Lophiostoma macrostomum CBS 122681]|uniref:Uncharacterized protein n=1 Tax=Lophiostoma macrostomum CBS 122681 TaxID=1314788 RepID=A0A6A6TKR5_9PLEO|nr:hypothetical protein K491DRAFT_135536 [Lophiostoma macrostomum CBS 122681]